MSLRLLPTKTIVCTDVMYHIYDVVRSKPSAIARASEVEAATARAGFLTRKKSRWLGRPGKYAYQTGLPAVSHHRFTTTAACFEIQGGLGWNHAPIGAESARQLASRPTR